MKLLRLIYKDTKTVRTCEDLTIEIQPLFYGEKGK